MESLLSHSLRRLCPALAGEGLRTRSGESPVPDSTRPEHRSVPRRH